MITSLVFFAGHEPRGKRRRVEEPEPEPDDAADA